MIKWTANYTTASEQFQNRTHGVDTLTNIYMTLILLAWTSMETKGGDVKRIVSTTEQRL